MPLYHQIVTTSARAAPATLATLFRQCAKQITEEHGVMELFGRGLKTRLLANGMQGIMFSIMWKYLDDVMRKPASTSEQ